jgi:hypothetical protein
MAVRGSISANLGVSKTTKMLSELTLQSSALIFLLFLEREEKRKTKKKKKWQP